MSGIVRVGLGPEVAKVMRVFAGDVEVAALLVQKTRVRMMLFHHGQGGKRVINQATVAFGQGL